MKVMKTSLTIIPMCPWERFSLYKSLSRLVLCYKKDWAILLHFIYFCYLLLVTNYLITKLSVTYNFSACRVSVYKTRGTFLYPFTCARAVRAAPATTPSRAREVSQGKTEAQDEAKQRQGPRPQRSDGRSRFSRQGPLPGQPQRP